MKISTLCKINFMKFVFTIEVRSARIFFAFREILRVFAKFCYTVVLYFFEMIVRENYQFQNR